MCALYVPFSELHLTYSDIFFRSLSSYTFVVVPLLGLIFVVHAAKFTKTKKYKKKEIK